MSYSFTVKAKDKAAAKAAISTKFDEILYGQPNHKADRDAAEAAANAFVDIIADPQEGEEVNVSVNGSLSWQAEDVFTSANVNVTASVRKPS